MSEESPVAPANKLRGGEPASRWRLFDSRERTPLSTSNGPDLILAGALFALLSIGIVMVYSASAYLGLRANDEFLFLRKHLSFVIGGLFLMSVGLWVDYRRWSRLVYPLLFLSFLSLVLLFTGLGLRVNGAMRWYRFGAGQPSEFAKLILILFLGYSLAKKGEKIKNFSVGFLPTSLIAGLFVALVMIQPDLGTSAVLASVTVVLMVVAGARLSFLLFAGIAAFPILYHQLLGVSWRAARITAFLDPWAHEKDVGYQLVQSLKALGSGGFWGVGAGESKVKLGFLPEAQTDFIVPVLGEEFGFIGVAFVVALFGLIAWRGYRIAFRCPDRFGSFVAFGITTWFSVQALVNFCVVTGLIPTKGLTLPFVSYGGSSLLACMAAAGVLLNISAMDPPSLFVARVTPTTKEKQRQLNPQPV
jgi:cell division protein FtsW